MVSEWWGCRRRCLLACACDVVVDAMWWAIQGCAQGHRPCQGGWLCVTHECDAGVQKCAWCTPWHVSGRGVVGDVYWHVHAMQSWLWRGMQGCIQGRRPCQGHVGGLSVCHSWV